MIVIRSIDVRFVSHATEDESRLHRAAEQTFGVKFSTKTTKGHWENPIRVFTSRLAGEEAEQLLRRVASAVPVQDFKSQSDDKEFYIRVSKAALLRNAIEPGDDVQLRVKAAERGVSAADVVEKFWRF